MKRYKIVRRDLEDGTRHAPFAHHYRYAPEYFPRRRHIGPWLERTGPLQKCWSGYHFIKARNLRLWLWSLVPCSDAYEVWEVHVREATYWACKGAARRIRFVRRLTAKEIKALVEK